jgi:hypothetical protein
MINKSWIRKDGRKEATLTRQSPRTKETHEKPQCDVQTEIGTGHLLNTSQGRYHLNEITRSHDEVNTRYLIKHQIMKT